MASIEELRKVRKEKLEKLRKKGINPYPSTTKRTHTIQEALESFGILTKSEEDISIVGRVRAMRTHGGSTFLDLQDGTETMQIFCAQDELGDEMYTLVTELTDIGDFIEVSGPLFTTKQEAKTLNTKTFRIIVKALRPVPEKHFGLEDVETRLRKRYLDLLVNNEAHEAVVARTHITNAVRAFLNSKGYWEVETPILQPHAGGANARPFKTESNAYNMELFLRIAPELYLKRLLVGGFEGVYEIARNFRNEGVDAQHNPEFTMLELYAAYRDYQWMMGLLEDMLRHIAKTLYNRTSFVYNGSTIDLEKPFKHISFNSLLRDCIGLSWEDKESAFKKTAQQNGVEPKDYISKGGLADELYKKVCRSGIIQPTFVTGHPIEISPFAKRGSTDQKYTERFHLILGGMEVANGFSELNDPVDQRMRFEEQQKLREKGDEEAHGIDESFLEALEYGMPPAAGVGVGMDRLAAIFTDNQSIRDVIAFPFLKPKDDD